MKSPRHRGTIKAQLIYGRTGLLRQPRSAARVTLSQSPTRRFDDVAASELRVTPVRFGCARRDLFRTGEAETIAHPATDHRASGAWAVLEVHPADGLGQVASARRVSRHVQGK